MSIGMLCLGIWMILFAVFSFPQAQIGHHNEILGVLALVTGIMILVGR